MKGVIFDFDGTLVDTMPIHFEAYRRTFDEIGLELTEDDFFSNVGGKATETIPKFLRGRESSKTPLEIHRRKKEIVGELFTSGEISLLDTAKLIDAFAQHVPIAIASSGSRPGIEILLKRLGWTDKFKAVITGEDASNGKPAPDLFLLAAEKIGIDPRDCLAFEDTDDGVASATAAGMTVIDVRRTSAPSSR